MHLYNDNYYTSINNNNHILQMYLKYKGLCKYTGPRAPLADSNNIKFETISPSLLINPDYVPPQVIQETLKTCGVELEKFECCM